MYYQSNFQQKGSFVEERIENRTAIPLSRLSSINLHNDSISWCRTQLHPITGQDQPWTEYGKREEEP